MNKYCSNCGSELQEGSTFCGKCGSKVDALNGSAISYESTNVGNGTPKEENNSKATTSMVCGIIGLFIAGIILGIIAIVTANQCKAENNGVFPPKAKTGFILGIIDVVGAVIAITLM